MKKSKYKISDVVLVSLIIVLVILSIVVIKSMIDLNNYPCQEMPVQYHKNIEAKIIDIDKKQYSTPLTHGYEVKITVKSEEYNLEETFTIQEGTKPKEWKYKEGNTVSVELYSWVLDSTGEVVKREINKIN